MPSRSDAAGGAVGDTILEAVREHTHLLLGTTIGYSDEDWAQPSRLPGWSRSHVAAHLVENARGLLRVTRGLSLGRSVRMYQSEAERVRAIELGAMADGLDLQINLDTTAGELQEELAGLLEDSREVQLRAGYALPARQIPLARLYELALHTFDLNPADDEIHLSQGVAQLLLDFKCERLGRRADLPALLIAPDGGAVSRIGAEGEPTKVSGPPAALLAWLARDVPSPQLIFTPPFETAHPQGCAPQTR